MLRDRWAGNLTIKSSVHQRLRHKECHEVKLKTYWGTKKIPAHERSTFTVLKWPISVALPSELDLGGVCWRLAPAVPAEFILGHNYQWQCLREGVVSLTDRQQNTVDSTMKGWGRFIAEEGEKKRMRCQTGRRHKNHTVPRSGGESQWRQHVHSRISTDSVMGLLMQWQVQNEGVDSQQLSHHITESHHITDLRAWCHMTTAHALGWVFTPRLSIGDCLQRQKCNNYIKKLLEKFKSNPRW